GRSLDLRLVLVVRFVGRAGPHRLRVLRAAVGCGLAVPGALADDVREADPHAAAHRALGRRPAHADYGRRAAVRDAAQAGSTGGVRALPPLVPRPVAHRSALAAGGPAGADPYLVRALAGRRGAAARRRHIALTRVAPRALGALLAAGLVALPAALAAQQRHHPRPAATPRRPPAASTGARVPTPKSLLGFEPGDDRKLADWPALLRYYQALGQTSDRVRYRELGKTTLGAPLVALVISSPSNLKSLDHYRQPNA